MWKVCMQTTAASEIMCQGQGQTWVCVGSYLNRPDLMSPWNQPHPSSSSILPHQFPRGALPMEVPGDLSGGINLPACSTWGHLICMRAAETCTWADQRSRDPLCQQLHLILQLHHCWSWEAATKGIVSILPSLQAQDLIQCQEHPLVCHCHY